MAKKEDAKPQAQDQTVLYVDENGAQEAQAEKKKPKSRQTRYIFKSDQGWYEKEKDNARITKYYPTQQKAIEAAKLHIKNSGLPGTIVIQSKTGKIRANAKVGAKK